MIKTSVSIKILVVMLFKKIDYVLETGSTVSVVVDPFLLLLLLPFFSI